ncbi:MAG TPA: hypothetical protein VGL86_13095 [Polyangia bacterium]|jgi:hypothetical protein
MRLAVTLLFGTALCVAAGCGSSDGSPFPVAPASSITLTTVVATVTGTTVSEMIDGTTDCPADRGIGMHAATQGIALDVVFLRWPEEGAVYDLSVPGTSDYVIASGTSGGQKFCTPEQNGSGTIVVNHFEQYGTRYLADVEVSAVAASTLKGTATATLDGHLYQ